MENCPNCQSLYTKTYLVVDQWRIKKCQNCDILYTSLKNKKLISEVNKTIYGSEYISNYKSRAFSLKTRHERLLRKIERFKNGGKLLDIGCGLGYFLRTVENSKVKWIVEGVEPNRTLINESVKITGAQIREGSLPNLPLRSNKYDVVTCLDVLEHSFEWKKNIEGIRRILKGHGILIIQAPNYKSFMAYLCGEKWDWWSPPDHILHFSLSYIVKYLEKNGFDILEKSTYEDPKEFLLNIKGRWRLNFITKLVFYTSIPLLLVLERIGWTLGFGGLLIVVAKKR